jgi:hypothetical protein
MTTAVALALAALLSPPAAPEAPSALTSQPGGWKDILPGPGLAGWTRVAPISTSGVLSHVDPKLEVWAPDRKTGTLQCRGHLPPPKPGQLGKDGKPDRGGSHEMLRYDKPLGDFIFHVEWRFADPARSGVSKGWNAGVYARVNDAATVWHQAAVGAGPTTNWFGDTPDETGKIARRKLDPGAPRVKPPGQWNVYEITARGDRLSLWVNGAVVSEWTGLRVPRGHVGLEAELYEIEFRNLRLKELRN